MIKNYFDSATKSAIQLKKIMNDGKELQKKYTLHTMLGFNMIIMLTER